jgi:hypothetical protein
MRYLCLVYHDIERLNALPAGTFNRLAEETIRYNEEMRRGGPCIYSNELKFVDSAVTVRVGDGTMSISDDPYISKGEQLGGYILIEARDLNDAIRVASRLPPARLGYFEVRPVKSMIL